MNTAGNWVVAGVGIEVLGGLLLLIAFEGVFPLPFAVLVVSVGSAVLLIGLIAVGVKVGLKDADLAVQQEGDAPAAFRL